MKRKSLLMMLLLALFVPLAMNAQTRSLHSPKLDKLKMNSAVARENAQNEMFVKSPVQIPNLESRNFSLENANNAMGSSITRDGVTYELVTTSQSDWSGNYVMAVPFSETVGYGFDGTIDDNTGGITQVALENSTNMTSIGDAAVLTIAPSTADPSYYTIQINGGDYLADGTNGLETSSTETNYTNWDISLTSDGMQIYNPIWNGGPYYLYFLYFENTSTSSAGAFFLTDDGTSYTSETVEGYEFEYIFPYLYKEVSSGGGYTDCDYEKVTASQTDWSGDYVITYVNGTTANVLTGKASGGNYGDYTTATITDNTLANADVAAYNVTIAKDGNYYTLKIGDQYLGYTWTGNSNNYLAFSATTPTTNQYRWTITYTNNRLRIANANSTNRYLQWNNTTNQQRFACYRTTSNMKEISLFKKLTECEPPCPAPTNLTYSNVTGEGATLAWDGEADSYSIHIGSAPKTYDFEDGSLQGWSAVDNDGDGYAWSIIDNNSISGSHGGDYFAIAWYNEDGAADNWLISPQFELGGSISFWIRRLNNSNYHDYYRVYVSTTTTDISAFTEITSGTIEPGTSYSSAVSYDLSSYSGMGYVAIRHTAAQDQAYLYVDDITITEGGQTIPNVTSPYTVTGLNPATEYVWQVMGDCGDGDVSQWSTSSTFTTLDLCATPTDLSSADITNNSAALSWTGLADTYNIQYREYDATAPATIILTVGDVWGDGSGYQMLLDADATAYTNGISDYSIFEYKIPTNADYNTNTSNIVVNSSVSIQIPAGTYDFFIANPTPDDAVYIAGTSGNVGGRKDNYVFEAGLTYEFVVSRYGSGDGVDVTITGDWTLVEGETSPYTLTGLNPGTTYAWQVQGEGCDNWSASAFFTTLAGTLVESISADDVTVNVGGTATITPTVLPADATNPAVTYTSNDVTIATVDDNGVVTGVGVGETTITIAATDGSGVTGTITVTVNGIDVTGITADNVTVVNGQTATITYTVAPANASDQTVTFTSANTNIATVDAEGVVTGVGVGTTTITIASVSNPEVTAEINVTVTSNPDAVQFTVNAPANAQPGDVITVEAVLTAPTSGNYDGFNALLTGIYYDNTAFELVSGSITNGAVAQQAQQMGAMIMSGTDTPGVVQLTIASWNGTVTAEGVVFSAQFTVLENTEGSFEFIAKPVRDAEFTLEGVFITYEFTPSTVAVSPTYTLHINGYGTGNGNWYLIASPVSNTFKPSATLGFVDATPENYDLYYFDEAQEKEWINFKEADGNVDPGFDIVSGKGYLYASKNGTTLKFQGTPYSGNGKVSLAYTTTSTHAATRGWNLIGNPFDDAAALDDLPYYRLNSEGSALSADAGTGNVAAMEGVFVYAYDEQEDKPITTATFTKSKGSKHSIGLININIINTRGNVADNAIIRFDEGRTMPKFTLRDDDTKVYIPMGDKDYAIVSSNGQGSMPVNFKAKEMGMYTISVETEGIDLSYLHLIDRLTGENIDLLLDSKYSFIASNSDMESRFILSFGENNINASNETFAFQSGSDIIVNGEGELQIFDVMGRMVMNTRINGVETVNVPANAVYIFKLDEKVQKIVVR